MGYCIGYCSSSVDTKIRASQRTVAEQVLEVSLMLPEKDIQDAQIQIVRDYFNGKRISHEKMWWNRFDWDLVLDVDSEKNIRFEHIALQMEMEPEELAAELIRYEAQYAPSPR